MEKSNLHTDSLGEWDRGLGGDYKVMAQKEEPTGSTGTECESFSS